MAVGAYAAYNFYVRIDGMPLIAGACCWAAPAPPPLACCSACQSLRIKGLYLAVATLAAQFFCRLGCSCACKWFTNYSSSGSVSASATCSVFGFAIEQPGEPSTCSAWRILVVLALLAKNLVRGAIGPRVDGHPRHGRGGRRDRHSPHVRQAQRLCRQLLHRRRGRCAVGLRLPGRLGAGGLLASTSRSSLLFMVIIGGLGSIMGSFFGAAFIVVLPICLNQFLPALARLFGVEISTAGVSHAELMIFGAPDRVVPDRRAAWPGQAVVHRQAEAAPVALPALTFPHDRFRTCSSRASPLIYQEMTP